MSTTSPDGQATPAEPGAIDYDRLIAKLTRYADATDPFHSTTMNQAIAAVEALRARVAELGPLVRDGVRRAENCMQWQARAESAEAHMAALAGALKAITNMEGQEEMTDGLFFLQTMDLAHTALAAMPAEVTERARAMEAKGFAAGLEAAAKACEGDKTHPKARYCASNFVAQAYAKAIRALGQEGP